MLGTLETPSMLSPGREARILLKNTVVDEDNQIFFPVDALKIAARLEISVSTAALDPDVAGLIVKEDAESPVQIVLNEADSETRQRFTCAHEIGHYIKRVKGEGDEDSLIGFVDYRNEVSGQGTDFEEIWANQFAAELLMPAFAVRQYWADGESVHKMAKSFGVSRAAMEVRVSALKLA